MGSLGINVGLVSARETYELRRMVLRPGLSIGEVAMEHDEADRTFHVGATDGGGVVVAIMTVMRDSLPKSVPGTQAGSWRIRGMASHPDLRGTGLGGAVLEFGVANALSISKDTVWCNARRVAYGFYLRHGFELVGPEFEIPGIGLHTVMALGLRGAG